MKEKDENCIGSVEEWNVLIVDDTNFAHLMVKEINKDLKFQNRKIKFHSAYTSEEAKEMLRNNDDIALVLLDLFLEEPNAGLEIAEYIRKDLKNLDIRIVLITASSSMDVKQSAIFNYDINGYEYKADLFSKKLTTVILSALRGYRDIIRLKNNRKAMEQMVESIAMLYEERDLESFLMNSLCHLSSLINQCIETKPEDCKMNSLAAVKIKGTNRFEVIGGKGSFGENKGKTIRQTVSSDLLERANDIYIDGDHKLYDDYYIAKYKSGSNDEAFLIIERTSSNDNVDRELLDVFHKSISASYENLCLSIEIEKTQREILYTLGEVTEARSEETGYHVKRVSKYCKILATEYGLSPRDVILLTNAAPIHDLGKIGIPDKILLKPCKLTKEEFEIIKTHTTIGHNLLKNSNREVLKTAAIVAHEHHERYDGEGYPRGLKGEDIHIYGRIVAIADVFDALGSPRVYKRAWSIKEILDLFKEERGKHFDPVLVDILFDNLDKFLEIRKQYIDEMEIDDQGRLLS